MRNFSRTIVVAAALAAAFTPSLFEPAWAAAASASGAASATLAQRGEALDTFAREIERRYVFPETARKLATELRKSRAKLLETKDPKAFAKQVDEIGRRIANDV